MKIDADIIPLMASPDDLERWRAKGYQPLGKSSIRLLSIKPGFPSEPMECGFITIQNLEDAPPYDALSYVWSTQPNPEPITCNGVNIPITRNLADALKHLRNFPGWDSVVRWPNDHPLHSERNVWGSFARNRNEQRGSVQMEHASLLWVDALCINQEDYSERAEQVAIMGQIYSRASNVTIWLGKEDRRQLDPATAIVGLPNMSLVAANVPQNSMQKKFYLGLYGMMPICLTFIAQALKHAGRRTNRLAAMKPTEDLAHQNMAYGFPDPEAKEWNCLRDFFSNPWFQRSWVAQEAVLASRAMAVIGDWEIDWASIGQAANWFHSKGYGMPAVVKYQMKNPRHYLPVSKAASVWELSAWPERRIPLLILLREFRTRHATVAADKIYATFGLAEETSQAPQEGFHELLRPNYNKDVKDVYRDTARFLIIEHGNLDILSHSGGMQTQPGWPSWVPDWRNEKASNELSTPKTKHRYNAGGGESLAIGISEDPNSLILQGIEVDIVKAYGDSLTSYGFGFVTYQEEIDFAKSAWTLFVRRPAVEHDPYTDRSVDEVFIHTLTAGLSNKNSPISADPSFLDDAVHWFNKYAPKHLPASPLMKRTKWSFSSSPDSGNFHEAFVRTCIDRRFFVSRNGLMGIGPDTMKEGDVVAILFGGEVPYVLRPFGDRYRFIGECYVHGLMEGEAIHKWEKQSKKQCLFELF